MRRCILGVKVSTINSVVLYLQLAHIPTDTTYKTLAVDTPNNSALTLIGIDGTSKTLLGGVAETYNDNLYNEVVLNVSDAEIPTNTTYKTLAVDSNNNFALTLIDNNTQSTSLIYGNTEYNNSTATVSITIENAEIPTDNTYETLAVDSENNTALTLIDNLGTTTALINGEI